VQYNDEKFWNKTLVNLLFLIYFSLVILQFVKAFIHSIKYIIILLIVWEHLSNYRKPCLPKISKYQIKIYKISELIAQISLGKF